MEEEKQEVTESEDTGEGNKSEVPEILKQASSEREGLERENERLEGNLKELKELRASEILGGKSETGEPKKETTPLEYMREVMDGKHGK